MDADDDREGSHTDNDASDPWINTVTSIESIVARSGLPSDRDDDRKKDKMEQQQQQSRSPPSSAAPAKSPMNGNSVQVAASAASATAAIVTAGDRNLDLSKSPPKEVSSSPTKASDNNKRLQPSPSKAGDVVAVSNSRRSMTEEPERESREPRTREKQPAPPVPNKDLNRHNNDEPDMTSSKPHRSSQNNSRPKNVVPTVISPLLVDVRGSSLSISFFFRLVSTKNKR